MRHLRLLLPALLLTLVLVPAGTAGAQGGSYVECADFTPASVRDACDRAVPVECRGPDAPADFNACLREHGTSPEAVRAAIESAERAAGIPAGGVAAGGGGLAPGNTPTPVVPLLASALALLAVVGLGRRSDRS
jgi:hypothetical protein